MKILVQEELCQMREKCITVKVCPVGAISQNGNNTIPIVNNDKCILCGKCVMYCPNKAFKKVKD